MNFYNFYEQIQETQFNEFHIAYERFNKLFAEGLILEAMAKKSGVDPLIGTERDFDAFMNDQLGTENLKFYKVLASIVFSRKPLNPVDYISGVIEKVQDEMWMGKGDLKEKLLIIKNGTNPITKEPIAPEYINNELMKFFNISIQNRMKNVYSTLKSRSKAAKGMPDGLQQQDFDRFGDSSADPEIDNPMQQAATDASPESGQEIASKQNTEDVPASHRMRKQTNDILKQLDQMMFFDDKGNPLPDGEERRKDFSGPDGRIAIAKEILLKREDDENQKEVKGQNADGTYRYHLNSAEMNDYLKTIFPNKSAAIFRLATDLLWLATQKVIDKFNMQVNTSGEKGYPDYDLSAKIGGVTRTKRSDKKG